MNICIIIWNKFISRKKENRELEIKIIDRRDRYREKKRVIESVSEWEKLGKERDMESVIYLEERDKEARATFEGKNEWQK